MVTTPIRRAIGAAAVAWRGGRDYDRRLAKEGTGVRAAAAGADSRTAAASTAAMAISVAVVAPAEGIH